MRILILGAGKMGSFFTDILSFQHETAVFDVNPHQLRFVYNTYRFTTLEEIKEFEPELVINAVTVKYTLDAFRKVLPVLPKDCIISDIASVKTGLKKFYEESGFRYVSSHPMFGPTFASLSNLSSENAIIISEGDHLGKIFFKDLYQTLRLNIFEYTFDEHDETVAYSLSIPFVSTFVFAAVMKHQEAPGTTFKKHMAIAKGLLSEDDYLLQEILFNPRTPGQVTNIRTELKNLLEIIENKDAEGMKKKFGIMGEPLFLGVIVGCGIGALACENTQELVNNIPSILGLGIKMGAVMELIPRITSLFIEGLRPISDATRELIARKFKNAAGLNIGMSPALVIGHPTTLVVSLLLIPVTLFLSVVLPGNQFLPLASLAGMFYLFPAVLPVTKGNVLKTFIIGLVALIVGLYFVTDLAPFFTQAAQDVFAKTGDSAVKIPEGFQGGALDFASSLFSWIIFHLVYNFKIVGSAVLVICTLALAIFNRRRIIKESRQG